MNSIFDHKYLQGVALHGRAFLVHCHSCGDDLKCSRCRSAVVKDVWYVSYDVAAIADVMWVSWGERKLPIRRGRWRMNSWGSVSLLLLFESIFCLSFPDARVSVICDFISLIVFFPQCGSLWKESRWIRTTTLSNASKQLRRSSKNELMDPSSIQYTRTRFTETQ